MPNTYTSVGSIAVNTTDTYIYAPGNGTTSIVKSIYLSNVNTGTYYVTVSTELENSGPRHILLESGQVPAQSTLQVIDGTLVLNTRAGLYVHASETGSIHVTAAVLEIT